MYLLPLLVVVVRVCFVVLLFGVKVDLLFSEVASTAELATAQRLWRGI